MSRFVRWGAVAMVALVAPVMSSVGAAASGSSYSTESDRLSQRVQQTLAGAGFGDLVDYDHVVDGVAQQTAYLPNVDTAVIELNAKGRVVGAANVLLDRDSPEGYRVDVPRSSLSAQDVQFARWRLERWDDQSLWDAGPAPEDVLVDPSTVDKEYMVAYPASVLKDMVAFSVLRMVDDGTLTMQTPVVYHKVKGDSCAYGPSNPSGAKPAPKANGATDTVRGWLDQMITVSDNFATCVLLQSIYDQGRLAEANDYFAEIGLETFRMWPSVPQVGSGWSSGTMTMGALDTAKLALVSSGATGTLWTTPEGRRVTASELSAKSRAYWRSVHLDQSFNEVLNPVNLCGSPDAVSGIPSTVSERWIDPETGHVVTYDGDLAIDFGYDVRPCLASAEVRFAHKTGLTYNAGGDAGIVRALPGQDGRWYVVATLTNVGNRFGDPSLAASTPNACEGSPYVCYPKAFGRVGAGIDQAVKERPAAVR